MVAQAEQAVRHATLQHGHSIQVRSIPESSPVAMCFSRTLRHPATWRMAALYPVSMQQAEPVARAELEETVEMPQAE